MGTRGDDIDWDRLLRFVEGRASAQELEDSQRWISSHPELGRIVETMRGVGRPPGLEQPAWQERLAWAAMQERIRRSAVRSLHVMRGSGEDSARIGPVRGWRRPISFGIAVTAVVVVPPLAISSFLTKRPAEPR